MGIGLLPDGPIKAPKDLEVGRWPRRWPRVAPTRISTGRGGRVRPAIPRRPTSSCT